MLINFQSFSLMINMFGKIRIFVPLQFFYFVCNFAQDKRIEKRWIVLRRSIELKITFSIRISLRAIFRTVGSSSVSRFFFIATYWPDSALVQWVPAPNFDSISRDKAKCVIRRKNTSERNNLLFQWIQLHIFRCTQQLLFSVILQYTIAVVKSH